jgi:hypothetical protein
VHGASIGGGGGERPVGINSRWRSPAPQSSSAASASSAAATKLFEQHTGALRRQLAELKADLQQPTMRQQQPPSSVLFRWGPLPASSTSSRTSCS